MEIKTEQDMIEFCKGVGKSFDINVISRLSPDEEQTWDAKNIEMISNGKIGKGSHLQQGILETEFFSGSTIVETPYLYPSPKLLAENPELTGPSTGVLVNCYDPTTKRFLYHMRGVDISAPFGFQAAAAGMGVYGQHPAVTAALELYQEAGLEKFRHFQGLRAIDALPFMKGGKIPQPLFSFGFFDNLSRFPVCKNLDDIAKFETNVKEGLKTGTLTKREGYHFTIPSEHVEKVAGELNDKKRFYGPIYESTINFVKALKDSLRL